MINQFQSSKKDINRIGLISEEIRDTMSRKKIRKIDSSENKAALKAKEEGLKNAVQEHEECKRTLASAFFTLSENIVRYAKFQLIDADDAVQEGVMICFDKIDQMALRRALA
jgi:hypothetical protein